MKFQMFNFKGATITLQTGFQRLEINVFRKFIFDGKCDIEVEWLLLRSQTKANKKFMKKIYSKKEDSKYNVDLLIIRTNWSDSINHSKEISMKMKINYELITTSPSLDLSSIKQ